MRYHKQLTRKKLLKYGWKKILLMAASEFSRAESLSDNGGGRELKNCLLRAKELLGVTESDHTIPNKQALNLLKITRQMADMSNVNPGKIYKLSMRNALGN